jgi:hypothetical protein
VTAGRVALAAIPFAVSRGQRDLVQCAIDNIKFLVAWCRECPPSGRRHAPHPTDTLLTARRIFVHEPNVSR